MSFVDQFDIAYCDDYYPAPLYAYWKSPMTDKNFHDGYNHYDTLDAAITGASRRASKQQIDVTVYQAVKKVSPKKPEVDVTDVKI